MIRIIAAGRIKERRLGDLIADYQRRIRALSPFAMVEVRSETPAREAAAMLRQLGSVAGHELVIALQEDGEELTSRDFAALLGGRGAVAFLIGGADGLDDAARARADRRLRLSAMTLTHELARLVLIEQIYRGLTILRGHPYHRG